MWDRLRTDSDDWLNCVKGDALHSKEVLQMPLTSGEKIESSMYQLQLSS